MFHRSALVAFVGREFGAEFAGRGGMGDQRCETAVGRGTCGVGVELGAADIDVEVRADLDLDNSRVLPLDVDRDDVWLHCSLAELVAQAVRQTEYPAEAGNDVERPA